MVTIMKRIRFVREPSRLAPRAATTDNARVICDQARCVASFRVPAAQSNARQ